MVEEFPPTLESLLFILRKLRAPGGCPWDKEQTRRTLSRCLAEECAEFLDAVDRDDKDELLDELGDVLMNVVFQAVVAEEAGEFTPEDVLRNLNAKLIQRHPHVFGEVKVNNASEVTAVWEKVKREREGRVKESLMDGIPASLSALNRAEKLQKKAASAGFDWQDVSGILDKVREELDELEAELARGDEAAADDELGDIFFALSNLARFRKRGTSEELLRGTSARFEARFRYMESTLRREGLAVEEATPERREGLWNEAKRSLGHKKY